MYENSSFAEGYAIGRDSNNANGMFGGEWGWWVLLLLAFGYGGFGGFGGFGGGAMTGLATSADIQRGFDTSAVLGKLDGITNGLCDGFYAINTGLLTGFNGVNMNICNLAHEISDCCCATQRAIDGVNYNIAKSTCDITHAINDSTNHILGYLTNEKISTLQLENQALKFQASQANQNAYFAANQEAQTAELIRRLGRDVPVPSYLVPNPNCCYTMPYPATATANACACGI